MKISGNPVTRSLSHVLALFRRGDWLADIATEEPPLRSELFSADQMALHGKALAAAHSLGVKRTRDLLLARLAQNEGVLLKACALLTAAIKDGPSAGLARVDEARGSAHDRVGFLDRTIHATDTDRRIDPGH